MTQAIDPLEQATRDIFGDFPNLMATDTWMTNMPETQPF